MEDFLTHPYHEFSWAREPSGLIVREDPDGEEPKRWKERDERKTLDKEADELPHFFLCVFIDIIKICSVFSLSYRFPSPYMRNWFYLFLSPCSLSIPQHSFLMIIVIMFSSSWYLKTSSIDKRTNPPILEVVGVHVTHFIPSHSLIRRHPSLSTHRRKKWRRGACKRCERGGRTFSEDRVS